MEINTLKYIESYLYIKDKGAKIVPFKPNAPQLKLYDAIKSQSDAGLPIRVIVLKARQMGFSTMTEGVIFKNTTLTKNVQSVIVAHKEDATDNLYKMFRRFYDNLTEPLLKPLKELSNAKELSFADIKSRIRCYTAGGTGLGRSDTTNYLHVSELAFWGRNKKDLLDGLLQSVPNLPDTMIIIESTPNGYEYYKLLWDMAVAGESSFIPVFAAWWELPEYTMAAPSDVVLTEREKELMDTYNLCVEQLMWRRWCISNNCGGDEEVFRQEYPSNPFEAFLGTGSNYFGVEGKTKIARRIEELRDFKPLKRGYFDYDYDGLKVTNISWVDDEKGYISIFKEPQKGHPYVISGDTAGEGSDWFSAHVLDNSDGCEAAVYHKQYGNTLFVRQMYCLGTYYNDALIGIEVNFDGGYAVTELQRLGYTNQYLREREDSIQLEYMHKHGFKTTSSSRKKALEQLAQVVREEIETIFDIGTLKEMLVFNKDENGIPHAEEGEHDDKVLSRAISIYIRPQQVSTIKTAPLPQKSKLISKLKKI